MKNLVSLLLFFCALTAFGQKQKEKDMQAKIDTLTKANTALTASNKTLSTKSDSLAKELDKYFGLYTVIKDKVVKKDFDPVKMTNIIDSLRAGRDSLTLNAASGALLGDSLKRLVSVNDSLVKENAGLMYAVKLLKGGSATSPVDLKDFAGTWNIITRKVKLAGESPRAAIIDISTEPVAKGATFLDSYALTSVNFLDKEFAELTFSNGEKGKCYYVITDFSKTKPYYIDFKGTKADFRMYFMNSAVGTRISFQIPGAEGKYYFGQMTK
jgi:hypothetical protein